MSITFQIDNIASHHNDGGFESYTVECGECGRVLEEGLCPLPDRLSGFNPHGVCELCNNTEEEPDGPVYVTTATAADLEPVVNVSNRNAFLLLEAFQIERDYCGRVDVDKLRLGVALLNDDAVRPTQIDGNFIQYGITSEQIASYRERFTAMLDRAEELGEKIIWG